MVLDWALSNYPKTCYETSWCPGEGKLSVASIKEAARFCQNSGHDRRACNIPLNIEFWVMSAEMP